MCSLTSSQEYMTSNAIGGNAPEASPAELDTKTKHARRLDGLLSERVGPVPVWIRAPKSGCEFYSGFSRAKLYQLADAGSIRTASIREPGKLRGTRLFNLESILAHVAKCEVAGGNL